jgi:hypothetical protein
MPNAVYASGEPSLAADPASPAEPASTANPATPASDESINGPCAMGTFLLEPLNEDEAAKPVEQRRWTLSFSDFPMVFELHPVAASADAGKEGTSSSSTKDAEEPNAWQLARPDGRAMARYRTRKGKLHLMSGQKGRQYETWLFDPTTVQDQAAGLEMMGALPLINATRAYAQLLVNSFTKGTQPLFTMALLAHDLPPAFRLLGLPAFHPDAAATILELERNAVRKLEGTYASGTFAVVAPEQGLSVAAASGWVALVSGVWSESEGYRYSDPLPYGYACNSAWQEFSLPGYWTLLQSQGAGESGTNHIYTTPMLPGLAMIATQSADSTLLTGMTLLHQPFMQGSVPPSLLPPFAPEDGWPQHIRALQLNAAMDWALLSPAAKQRRALVPPEASPLDSSSLSSTVHGIPGALGFRIPMCPGSENPMQARCAQRLADQMLEWLGEDYRMQGRFPMADGRILERLDERSVARTVQGGWLFVHEDDAAALPADRSHPFWEMLIGPDPIAKDPAEQAPETGGKSAADGAFAQPPMLELWVLPPGRR